MSTDTFEDRLQVALRDLADDLGTEPRLRWVAPAKPDRTRARRALAVAATVVAAVLLTAAVVVLRPDSSGIVEPVRQPPRVVGLSGQESAAPGRSVLAFTLSDASEPSVRQPYLVPVGSQDAVGLPLDLDQVVPTFNYARPQLSAGGGEYLVQDERRSSYLHSGDFPTIVVVDLATGRHNDLGGAKGFCPELSPDSRWVAYLGRTGVRRVEVRTGRHLPVQRNEPRPDAQGGCAGGIGWSPDGRLLAIGRPGHFESRETDSTRVLDLDGRTVVDLDGHLVNGSMSWSPDGATLLLYTPQTGGYAIARLDGSAPVAVRAPADATTAVGWAGSRIVWLLGAAGGQRLVTTDRDGHELRPWLRFDVGDLPVSAIQWSRDLGGTARH
jgi:hypothetical protein